MTNSSETKSCPFCAEEIKAAAIKCKYCGEFLDGRKLSSKLQPIEPKKTAKQMREEVKEMARKGRARKDNPKNQAQISNEIRAEKNKNEELKAQKPLSCPRCGSEQLTAQRKGFGWGKALVGGVMTGGIGLIAGFHGSRKVLITCLKCGHQFYPPKHK